jgi:hypothetical protein
MRMTAPLNRKYWVVRFLTRSGFTFRQAMKLWRKEVRPHITNEMDSQDIIKMICDGWYEMDLEDMRSKR